MLFSSLWRSNENDLFALWEGPVSQGGSYLLREAGERSCDSMLTSCLMLFSPPGTQKTGLNGFTSLVHYFYNKLLPVFFFFFTAAGVVVWIYRNTVMSKFT